MLAIVIHLLLISLASSQAPALNESSDPRSRLYNIDVWTVVGKPPEGSTFCDSDKPFREVDVSSDPFEAVCLDVPFGSGQVARFERVGLHQSAVSAAPKANLWRSTLSRLDVQLRESNTVPDALFWNSAVNAFREPNISSARCRHHVLWLKECGERVEVPYGKFVCIAIKPNHVDDLCSATLTELLIENGVDDDIIANGVRLWAQKEVDECERSWQVKRVVDTVMHYPDGVKALLSEDLNSWEAEARWRAWTPIEVIERHWLVLSLVFIVGFGVVALVTFGMSSATPIPVLCSRDREPMEPAFDLLGEAIQFGSALTGGIAGEVVGDAAGEVVGEVVGDTLGRAVEEGVGAAGAGTGLAPLWKCPQCGAKRRQHQQFYTPSWAYAAKGVGCFSVVVVVVGFGILCMGRGCI